MSKKFRFLDHTSDAKFQAYGRTLEEAFANAAHGLFSIIADLRTVKEIESRRLELQMFLSIHRARRSSDE